jgi:two-component system alkaline phosphatase synthesis response regulator PhoP
MKTILVIEDDPSIVAGLREALTAEHYNVLSAQTGEKGYTMAKRESVDLIILDLMLPDKNGEEVCRDLRKDGVSTPILMLTSKREELDKVVGLEIGADDYVTKPFSIKELLARIKALMRRGKELHKEISECSFGDMYVDFKKSEVLRNRKPVKLSVRELAVLKYFVQHEGEVVTRDMLLNEVWGYEQFPTTRTVDNYILAIRKKIEAHPEKPRHLLTVHTAGYKFVK